FCFLCLFFFSSRRRHTRFSRDWSSDVCSSDLTDEHSNLIIAGAGSGKTLTILGKVEYLIKHKNVQPNEILLLSFTQKTVSELNRSEERRVGKECKSRWLM